MVPTNGVVEIDGAKEDDEIDGEPYPFFQGNLRNYTFSSI
jgi:hypothetical protein